MRWARFAGAVLVAAAIALPSAAWAQASAAPFTTGYRYDSERRVTGTIAPDPDGAGPLRHAAVRNSYDAAGRLVRVETGELAGWQSEAVAPSSWPGFTVFRQTDTSYDPLDRKLSERVSAGGTVISRTDYQYDLAGRLQCTAVRMNKAVLASLVADGCTAGPEGGEGPDRITMNVYDAAGQLLQVRQAVGTPLEQAYATYHYTANGKQDQLIDANGNRATMAYDGFDRQADWHFPSTARPAAFNPATPDTALATAGAASAEDYEAYGYDANGNRTSWRKRDGRVFTYSYDALNRRVLEVVPDGCAPIQRGACPSASATRDLYYAYDLRGLQTEARFDGPGGGEAVLSSYDGFGRLTRSVVTMAGIWREINHGYDANGNLVRARYPDGHYVSYYRDGLDRLYYADMDGATQLFYPPYNAQGLPAYLYRLVGGAWGSQTSYNYDGIGRPTAVSQVVGGAVVTSSYAYNAASQIIGITRDNDRYAWTGGYNVDRDYATNGLNQYASAGPASFAYDANGNLLGDGSTSYGYDAENRLVSASNGVSLAYDPLGRLWQVSGATGATQLLYDGDQLSVEYDPGLESGAAARRGRCRAPPPSR